MLPSLCPASHLVSAAVRTSSTVVTASGSTPLINTARLPDVVFQRRLRSTGTKPMGRHLKNQQRLPTSRFFPVYVHHVSKLALEHLQRERSEWVLNKGLDNRLHINPNGTFVLSFPSEEGKDAGRIWTSYDPNSKQHWLSVYRKRLAAKFLLKDHGRSLQMQIHDNGPVERGVFKAVDQMITAINKQDGDIAINP